MSSQVFGSRVAVVGSCSQGGAMFGYLNGAEPILDDVKTPRTLTLTDPFASLHACKCLMPILETVGRAGFETLSRVCGTRQRPRHRKSGEISPINSAIPFGLEARDLVQATPYRFEELVSLRSLHVRYKPIGTCLCPSPNCSQSQRDVAGDRRTCSTRAAGILSVGIVSDSALLLLRRG
jgi:hypothetical protein